ncbi:MAG TPA: type II toxin-antitoxin system HicA family toxin [Thermoanaerobaculia bacterium]|nr:type II toxin-antitoxin system HicA family toxin [Thermoanaerobaculia bacterium]
MRRIRKIAKQRGVIVQLTPARGKGSHSTLYFGGRFTVVRDLKDELKTGTLHAMLQQLGLSLQDLNK